MPESESPNAVTVAVVDSTKEPQSYRKTKLLLRDYFKREKT